MVVAKATTKSVPHHESTTSNTDVEQSLTHHRRYHHNNPEDNNKPKLIRATNTSKTTTSIPNNDATTVSPAELGQDLPYHRLSRNIINPEDISNRHDHLHVANIANHHKSTSDESLDEHHGPPRLRYGNDKIDDQT